MTVRRRRGLLLRRDTKLLGTARQCLSSLPVNRSSTLVQLAVVPQHGLPFAFLISAFLLRACIEFYASKDGEKQRVTFQEPSLEGYRCCTST